MKAINDHSLQLMQTHFLPFQLFNTFNYYYIRLIVEHFFFVFKAVANNKQLILLYVENYDLRHMVCHGRPLFISKDLYHYLNLGKNVNFNLNFIQRFHPGSLQGRRKEVRQDYYCY